MKHSAQPVFSYAQFSGIHYLKSGWIKRIQLQKRGCLKYLAASLIYTFLSIILDQPFLAVRRRVLAGA